MATTVRFLGNTDEVTRCDCCGRENLKSTVALSIDEGEPVYYGVTCAALALQCPTKTVVSESRKANRAKERAEQEARDKARREADAPWFYFLAIRGTGSDTFRRIESLGGYTAAKAKFVEWRKGEGANV